MKMKRKDLALLLILLPAVLLQEVIHAQEPYFELQDLDNQWTSYSALKGEQLTVIDFWATWCQPCLRSLPALNDLYNEYKSSGVNFIGISIDGPRNQSKLKPFVNSMGLDYPILRDINSEIMSEMSVTTVPTLLIIDKEGEVVFYHEGYRPGDEKYIRSNIEENL